MKTALSTPPRARQRQIWHRRLRHASLPAVMITVVLALVAPIAFVDNSPAAAQAPTVPGAPFLPIANRTAHVLARYETATAIDKLDRAGDTLALRMATAAPDVAAELAETARILHAQHALLERALAELEAGQAQLIDETAPFGIGLAVFPVDEVRKPFWDDWGRPRSGGRRHVGTDVLAQVGVPLRAIEDSTIEALPRGGNGGNGVFMIGSSGSRYYYAHMDDVAELEIGERVLAGQPVGTIGDSGNARGAPHLHMQWDPNGGSDWQNPFPLLDVLFGAGRTQAAAEAASNALATGTVPEDTVRDVDIDGDADAADLAPIALLRQSEADERQLADTTAAVEIAESTAEVALDGRSSTRLSNR